MNQPQLKRRRLLSNSLVPLLTPNLLVASLKPSKISTCTSCHRTIGLKSSPPLVCARCSASTCAICVRTCTGDPLSVPSSRGTGTRNPSPHRLPLGNPSAASPSRRRRARDEDVDTVLKGPECEGTGCGRMICRICCTEILQSETVACLDCFAVHRALQAHGSGTPMQEAITDNILTASA
ncbi:hypothetical protein EDB86DRAFT_576148 [Lactarius hatsudake]|nr:hypothetical protein EDB86DRAFT_576148 [Lactarius hatsudake]